MNTGIIATFTIFNGAGASLTEFTAAYLSPQRIVVGAIGLVFSVATCLITWEARRKVRNRDRIPSTCFPCGLDDPLCATLCLPCAD